MRIPPLRHFFRAPSGLRRTNLLPVLPTAPDGTFGIVAFAAVFLVVSFILLTAMVASSPIRPARDHSQQGIGLEA